MNLFASMNFLLAVAPGLLASNVSVIGQVLGRNHQEASGSVAADTPEHATKGYQANRVSRSLSVVTPAVLALSVTSCDKEDTSFELHAPRDWFPDNLDAVYEAGSAPGATGSKCTDLAEGMYLGYTLQSIETRIHSFTQGGQPRDVWDMHVYYDKGCKRARAGCSVREYNSCHSQHNSCGPVMRARADGGTPSFFSTDGNGVIAIWDELLGGTYNRDALHKIGSSNWKLNGFMEDVASLVPSSLPSLVPSLVPTSVPSIFPSTKPSRSLLPSTQPSRERYFNIGTCVCFTLLTGAAATCPCGVNVGLYGYDTLGGTGGFIGTAMIASSDHIDTCTNDADMIYAAALADFSTCATMPALTDGLVVSPGYYCQSAAITIAAAATITLNAGGNSAAQFVFVSAGAITTGDSVHFVLEGGATFANVFWITTGAATLGANSISQGTFMSAAALTLGANATIYGRAIVNAAATMGADSSIHSGAFSDECLEYTKTGFFE